MAYKNYDMLSLQQKVNEIDNKCEKGYVDEKVSDINSSLEEKANKTEVNELVNNKAENKTVDNINANVIKNTNDIAAQSARIDAFTNLPAGSTTGDAELIDGRIGIDGTNYTNIGGAIRGQIGKINNALGEYYEFEGTITDPTVYNRIATIENVSISKMKACINEFTCSESNKYFTMLLDFSDGSTKYVDLIDGLTYSPAKNITKITIYADANKFSETVTIKGKLLVTLDGLFNRTDIVERDIVDIRKKEEKTDNNFNNINNIVGFVSQFSGSVTNVTARTVIAELKNVSLEKMAIKINNISIEDGKNFALELTYNDSTIKYHSAIDGGIYYRDGYKITNIVIYVDANYLTKEASVNGYIITNGLYLDTKEIQKKLDSKMTFDEIASKYRYLVFGFNSSDMKLTIGGSNDSCGNIVTLSKNIFSPTLGRKTLRDPSYMYYKGFWYFTYTTIDWGSGNGNIGFCVSKDLVNFRELEPLSLNNTNHPNIPRCYAPAFCVIDDHIYIITQMLGTGGDYVSVDGNTYDESTFSSGYKTMVHEYFPNTHTLNYVGDITGFTDIDVHIYKVGSEYYACVRDFLIYKSSSLLGTYTQVWNGIERVDGKDVYREGAFMLRLPSGKWRIFAQKPLTAYDYKDSISENLDDGFETEIHSTNIDSNYMQHLTIRDMFDTDYNVIN